MNRWILFSARMGIVLLAVSAALYLVTALPLSGSKYTSTRTELLSPGTFSVPYATTPNLINPLIGIQVTAESNGTLNFKIYSLNYLIMKAWLMENHLTQNLTTQTLDAFNALYSSYLVEDFKVAGGKISLEIVPSVVENATLVVVNPASAFIKWHYVIQTIDIFAPRDRSLSALTIIVPLGVALTVPWLAARTAAKWRSRKSGDVAV